MAVHENLPVIKFGTVVLTYNKSTGYENHTVHRQFRNVTPTDIKNLREGDTIWIDGSPIPNREVCGFVKTRVKKVEGNKIRYEGGFTTLHRTIFFLKDESILARMIEKNPKTTYTPPGS